MCLNHHLVRILAHSNRLHTVSLVFLHHLHLLHLVHLLHLLHLKRLHLLQLLRGHLLLLHLHLLGSNRVHNLHVLHLSTLVSLLSPSFVAHVWRTVEEDPAMRISSDHLPVSSTHFLLVANSSLDELPVDWISVLGHPLLESWAITFHVSLDFSNVSSFPVIGRTSSTAASSTSLVDSWVRLNLTHDILSLWSRLVVGESSMLLKKVVSASWGLEMRNTLPVECDLGVLVSWNGWILLILLASFVTHF